MKPNKTFKNLSAKKKEKITSAAIREFSEKGFSGASINSLVDRIGIAKGSIFQYFGDKKGLFLFIFNNCTDIVKKKLKSIRDETIDEELFTRLEKSLMAGIVFLKEHPMIYRLYLNVLFGTKIPFRDEILLSIRKYSYEYLRSLMEPAKQRGEIRKNLDIDKACFVLDAVMDRFLQAHIILHLDAGLGLHGADIAEITSWVEAITQIMKIGMGKTCSDEDLP